ncbi:hypothetical protein EIQ07_14995 [Xanthomonas campestris pv. campestris]
MGNGEWGMGNGEWGMGIRDSGFGIRDSGFAGCRCMCAVATGECWRNERADLVCGLCVRTRRAVSHSDCCVRCTSLRGFACGRNCFEVAFRGIALRIGGCTAARRSARSSLLARRSARLQPLQRAVLLAVF